MEFDIEAMYVRYGPMVFRRCRQLLQDQDEAMDAMQEVFVNLMRFGPRMRNQAPSSLLWTMASNHCLNVIKRQKRRVSNLGGEFWESLPSRDRGTEEVEARDLADRILATQDDRTRLIAWLHFVDGLTLEDTAAAVGMSLSGIRKRIRKLQAHGRQERFREAR